MKLTELLAKIDLPLEAWVEVGLGDIANANKQRVAYDMDDHVAVYLAHAANVLPELVDELNRLLDVVGEEDAEIIKGVLARAENVETKQ